MGLLAITGVQFVLLLIPAAAIVSVAVAVWVLARAPWPRAARIAVAVLAVVIGWTPTVVFAIVAWQLRGIGRGFE